MEADYKYGFGGIENVLLGEVDMLEAIDELKIKTESKIIIIPKIIGVYQFPRPNPESHKDLTNFLFEGFHSIFPIPGEAERVYPGLICIGYDPTVITPDVIKDFLDKHSRERIKITEYQDMPDFNDKKIDEIYNSQIALTNGLLNGESAVIERTFDVLNKLREEYGLTKFEYIGYLTAKMLSDSELRNRMRRDLLELSESLGIDIPGFLKRD